MTVLFALILPIGNRFGSTLNHNDQQPMKSKRLQSNPDRPYKMTGLYLPSEQWELLNRVAFERAKTKGGRASVSALIVELVDKHQKQLEKELASASR